MPSCEPSNYGGDQDQRKVCQARGLGGRFAAVGVRLVFLACGGFLFVLFSSVAELPVLLGCGPLLESWSATRSKSGLSLVVRKVEKGFLSALLQESGLSWASLMITLDFGSCYICSGNEEQPLTVVLENSRSGDTSNDDAACH